jgi:hypothetical protein
VTPQHPDVDFPPLEIGVDLGQEVRGPTRRERRAARAKFRWPPPPRLPDETVQDFRIRELGLYVAARRAWKLKRRRATWGGNAWRPAA